MKPFTQALRAGIGRIQAAFADTLGLGPGATLSAIVFSLAVVLAALFWFFRSAPPDTIILTSGEDGTRFQKNAERYAKILAKNGVKLKILPSNGSQENLERLLNRSFRVDIGFVQTGLAKGKKTDGLVSLGSVSYEPLYVFYRSDQPLGLLSSFEGKRLAIGEVGSGTRALSLELLARNGIQPGGVTMLLEMDDDEARKALVEGQIDAAFLMGDSASTEVMRDLMRRPGIRLFNFEQADGYTRRVTYLNKLVLLKGAIDFGKNIPESDVSLLSPTVELIAREDLHPALSDLLLETASEVHGRAGMFQRRGEFPAQFESEYPASGDAARYYKSGKSFLYRYLPFNVASLLNRVLVVFVPMLLVLIPGLKSIPSIYRWRMRLHILRWYRVLLKLEAEIKSGMDFSKNEELLARLDAIEQSVNRMKMPASFADQFYSLRVHIDFVRERLLGRRNLSSAPGQSL